jgi:hypothetical protein
MEMKEVACLWLVGGFLRHDLLPGGGEVEVIAYVRCALRFGGFPGVGGQ